MRGETLQERVERYAVADLFGKIRSAGNVRNLIAVEVRQKAERSFRPIDQLGFSIPTFLCMLARMRACVSVLRSSVLVPLFIARISANSWRTCADTDTHARVMSRRIITGVA